MPLAYIFTLNNYTQEDVNKLQSYSKPDYIIFGYEVAPTTGTPHLQGYIHYPKEVRISKKLSTMFKWYITPAKGSPQDNYDYCTKSGKFWERGKLPQQGKRTDLDNVRRWLDKGKTMRQILPKVTSYQSFKFAESAMKYTEQPRNWEPKVYWYYGPSGTGKTQAAFEIDPGAYQCFDPKWFDGYDAHETVIFDDLRPDDISFNRLLRLLDRYPCTVEIKGGTRQFKPRTIVITTPYEPEKFVPYGEEAYQLTRRIFQQKLFMDFIKEDV